MTPRRAARRTTGNRNDALRRLRLGEEYLERARLGDPDDPDARTVNVGIACTAAIAFADAICLAAAGERSSSDDHRDAVALLAAIDARAAQDLRVLLSTKTETQYGTAPLSREKATRAMRAAENLAVRAREI